MNDKICKAFFPEHGLVSPDFTTNMEKYRVPMKVAVYNKK